ncbi:transglycosylase domain-containing protein [Adlercreutzia sp. R7]|uniref:Transglycosylase domain-containing protein n=1 Tax=Adlercreutzia wanghongyangiae TaxID=3111451 RepID=A0ABU6IG67_9ACTN|nr:transglycosylase domain-containing protein [Adlercreutzia sp. R7]
MGSRAIKGRKGTKTKNKKAVVLGILSVLVACVAAGAFGVITLCNSWLQDLPDYQNADAYNSAQPTMVYAADGTTLLAEFQLENRDPVTLDQVSEYVLRGTVATEDERFYSHAGVDYLGVARALVNNLMGGALEGASTITQQFVRNTILSDEMRDISFKRKIREMYISLKLEEQYEKDEILLMYLNTINYGSGAYGIEAAAERYYSKDAKDLTLNEAATLVGIPQSPTYNNPIDYPENCLKRRNTVLDRMVSNGVITKEEADAVKAEPIELNPSEPSMTGILAYPYFTSYVRNQLTNPDGKYAYSTSELFKGGLKVYTTLDIDAQKAAEEAARAKEEEAGDPFEVSMAVVNPENGYIDAMVGGHDYETSQVNMATGEGGSGRQAGSAFKLFTLMAALKEGIDPDTLIDAGYKVELVGGEPVYNVNKKDYGTRTIKSAFGVSSNTAFIRLLMSVGVDKVIETAKSMGITSDMPSVAGLTLGIASVTPLEMAEAYATVANGGVHYEAECIVKIEDRNGNVIVDNSEPQGERVFSKEQARAAIDCLEVVIDDGTGKAARPANGQEAGGKTGTTDDKKDSWFCGVTPQYSVAIWLGDRSDYSKAKRAPETAASVFADFIDRMIPANATEKFFEAEKPDYKKDYRDEENHIGGYYSRKKDKDDTAITSKDPLDAADTSDDDEGDDGEGSGPASEGNGPNSGGSSGGDSPGSSGGDSSGGNTGGDSSGGNTGGDSSGGNTGGDSSGGNTGGDGSGGDGSGGSTEG